MKVLKLTPEQILAHIKIKGRFVLTWHYRVDPTMQVCRKLVKKGFLMIESDNRGATVFIKGMNNYNN